MRFIKLLFALTLSAVIFSGCTQEKIPDYNLNIIAPSFEKAYEYYSPHSSETEKYELLSADMYAEIITDETLPFIKSVTIADDNISTETAQEIIDICKKENVPVFFLMASVDKQVLDSYDKAYCITADYTYIGEKFAEKIHEMWKEEIRDKNGDKIFTFSVIKTESLSPVYQAYHDRLLEYIELLGVPMQCLEEIFLTKGDVLNYCLENKKANEAFIIFQSDYISAIDGGYEPAGDGVEILGIYFGVENEYEASPYMKLCFIDYTKYFDAKDSIINNIDNKAYPFENLNYSIIGKTVYIEPVL